MSEDILVNVTPQETRVALVLQGAVQELHVERTLSVSYTHLTLPTIYSV